jgi:predicted transcriptional regulator
LLLPLLEHLFLTAVQARIILTIFFQEGIGTASLVQSSRISGSAWAKQSRILAEYGVLASEEKKILIGKRMRKVRHYTLTAKGNQIARSIQEISHLLQNRQ